MDCKNPQLTVAAILGWADDHHGRTAVAEDRNHFADLVTKGASWPSNRSNMKSRSCRKAPGDASATRTAGASRSTPLAGDSLECPCFTTPTGFAQTQGSTLLPTECWP